jgi:hypothetical protein
VSRRVLIAAALPTTLLALLGPPRYTSERPASERPASSERVAARASIQASNSAYARLLARHVGDGSIDGKRLRVVDYEAIPEDPDYGLALAELAAARPEEMSRDERIAFWINAYNLLAIHLVIGGYPIGSILELGSEDVDVFEMEAGTAARRIVTLGEIEHVILRRQFDDPRIHFALVAAAASCPDLRVYDGARLDVQLEGATRAFLADEDRGVGFARNGVRVSALLIAFHEDFEPGGVAAFIRAHAPAGVAARMGDRDDHELGQLPYDWRLNDRARASIARVP